MAEGAIELETLAARVRAQLAADLVTEQRMFGGIAFLLGGHMLCCASRKGLMVRLARENEAAALQRPFAGPCLGAGRPMAGFIMVAPPGLAGDQSLAEWLALARAYVTTLPPKSAKVARESPPDQENRLTMFPGFPPETLRFLADLKANNDRNWFAEHRDSYERAFRAPAEAFVATISNDLEAVLGQPVASKVFRIHRDVRFSKDKSPYNAHLHVTLTAAAGGTGAAARAGFYFGLEPERLSLGAGVFELRGADLDRYRAAAADAADGTRLEALLGSLVADGYRIGEPELKRTPAPYPTDHPRAGLLRRKGLTAWRDTADLACVSSHELGPATMQVFRGLVPLLAWLDASVAV